jgi:hypothetical protein
MVSGTTLSPKDDQTDDVVIRAQALRRIIKEPNGVARVMARVPGLPDLAAPKGRA